MLTKERNGHIWGKQNTSILLEVEYYSFYRQLWFYLVLDHIRLPEKQSIATTQAINGFVALSGRARGAEPRRMSEDRSVLLYFSRYEAKMCYCTAAVVRS